MTTMQQERPKTQAHAATIRQRTKLPYIYIFMYTDIYTYIHMSIYIYIYIYIGSCLRSWCLVLYKGFVFVYLDVGTSFDVGLISGVLDLSWESWTCILESWTYIYASCLIL